AVQVRAGDQPQDREDARPHGATDVAGERRRGDRMKRRAFITLLGGAAAWPLAARAQQAAMPVIGVLDARSPGSNEGLLRGFRQGLKETGHVEGENVALEYRWADNQMDRLPALATELARRKVSIIAASTAAVALVAKQATTAVPIVFIVNEDPV